MTGGSNSSLQAVPEPSENVRLDECMEIEEFDTSTNSERRGGAVNSREGTIQIELNGTGAALPDHNDAQLNEKIMQEIRAFESRHHESVS
jgi:hypothetical protein